MTLTRPVPDPDSAMYWEALAAQRLLVQFCSSCNEGRFPPMPGCPACGSPESEEREVHAPATIYSWVRNHTGRDAPVAFAAVEVAPGVRIAGRVDGPDDDIGIGASVAFRFIAHEGWTELRFVVRTAVDDEPPQA